MHATPEMCHTPLPRWSITSFANVTRTSALPPLATKERTSPIGRDGPATDSCSATKIALFDHIVGTGKYGRRHVETQRLRRLEIEHHLVLGRCLHRQVGRVLALEDAVDVTC